MLMTALFYLTIMVWLGALNIWLAIRFGAARDIYLSFADRGVALKRMRRLCFALSLALAAIPFAALALVHMGAPS